MSDMQADSPVAAIQGPGHVLADAREARGLSVAEVAMRLKFAPRQIEALEADLYERLPGIAIVRGMVRGYARLLEVDATPLIAELDQRLRAGPTTVRPVDMHITINEGKKDGSRAFLVLSLIVAIAVAAFALEWYVRDRRAAKTVPPSAQGTSAVIPIDAIKPVSMQPGTPASAEYAPAPAVEAPEQIGAPSETKQIEAPLETAPAVIAPPPAAASETAQANEAGPLQMRFSEETWVEVKDAKGKVLVSRLAGAGTLIALDGDAPLSVVLGNAGTVQVNYAGEPVDLAPHTRTGVARLTLE